MSAVTMVYTMTWPDRYYHHHRLLRKKQHIGIHTHKKN